MTLMIKKMLTIEISMTKSQFEVLSFEKSLFRENFKNQQWKKKRNFESAEKGSKIESRK